MEYLDAHQTARLECLKLVFEMGKRSGLDSNALFAIASDMAEFVVNGTVPPISDDASEKATAA